MYRFYLKQGTEQYLLPVAPGMLTTKVGNSNKTVEILNMGEVNLLKEIGLRSLEMTVLLPGRKYAFVQTEGVFQEPRVFLNFFRKVKESKKPMQFIIFRQLADGSQLFQGNMEVSLETYTIFEKAGEEGDFWVKISLQEYRKIKSLLYQKKQEGSNIVMVPKGQVRDEKVIPKNYTVQKGDSLWRIAKTVLHDEKRYIELARRNDISNPNQIYVGQILRLEG